MVSEYIRKLKNDRKAIKAMLKHAVKEGLEVEVIAAFGHYRTIGDSVVYAASAARHDYDM